MAVVVLVKQRVVPLRHVPVQLLDVAFVWAARLVTGLVGAFHPLN